MIAGLDHLVLTVADLDATVDVLAADIAANSAESLAAYKDLYRNQQDLGLGDGLGFEYRTMYPMGDAGGRLDSFGGAK